MRGALGQRFYFNDQQVTLPAETARTNRKTDMLAAFSGQVLPKTVSSMPAGSTAPVFDRTERFNLGAR